MTVWVLEHRQWAKCGWNCMDLVVMDVYNTLEKAVDAIKNMQRQLNPETEGWFVAYPSVVDGVNGDFVTLEIEREVGHILNFYDLQGNKLENQPWKE